MTAQASSPQRHWRRRTLNGLRFFVAGGSSRQWSSGLPSSSDPLWFEVLRRWWFQLALVIWLAVLRPSMVWGPSSLVVPAGIGHLNFRPSQTLSSLRFFVAGGSNWHWSSGLPSSSDFQWFEVFRRWWFQLTLVIWLAVLSLLSLVLVGCLFHVRRRQRFIVAQGEVPGRATQSTTVSPSSGQRSTTAWVKKSPLRGPDIFHFFTNGWEFLIEFFTHLLYVPIYARLQIFIQLSPILTKLCHIKRDYPVHVICSKCPPSAETHAFRRLRKSLIALLIVVYGKSL